MADVLGQILSNAVGVAISPVPIIGMMLILFSQHAVRNGTAYVVGWFASIVLVVGLGLLTGVETSSESSESGGNLLQIGLGLLFLFLSWRSWHSRPGEGVEASTPGWMEKLGSASVLASFGMALAIGAVNAKNLPLNLSAAASIGGGDLPTGQEITIVLTYALIGSLTTVIPLLMLVLGRERVEPMLMRMKAWLIQNNGTIMMVLFLVLGTQMLGKGISASG